VSDQVLLDKEGQISWVDDRSSHGIVALICCHELFSFYHYYTEYLKFYYLLLF